MRDITIYRSQNVGDDGVVDLSIKDREVFKLGSDVTGFYVKNESFKTKRLLRIAVEGLDEYTMYIPEPNSNQYLPALNSVDDIPSNFVETTGVVNRTISKEIFSFILSVNRLETTSSERIISITVDWVIE